MKQLLVLIAVAATANGFGADTGSKTRGASQLPGLNRPVRAPKVPAPSTDDATSPSVTTTLPAAPSDQGITGFVDIRPTYDLSSTDNTSRLETSVGVGYKFSKDVNITLEQPFWHNLYTTNAAFNGPLETQLREGHVRLTVANVLAPAGPFTFGYEARAYYPSRRTWRDNGMVTAVRNIFQVVYTASPVFSIAFQEQLIYHVYTQPFGANGANPSFHNRFVVAPGLSLLGGKLSMGLPIFLDAIRNRAGNAPGQKGLLGGTADSWYWTLWINPEILYNVTKEVQLGVSYYSGDLIKPDFSGLTLGKGLSSGAPQLAMRVTL
jgi:hypothetical protein